ncbi:MAG: hypothetical protein ACE5LH_07735 [Fidelibacterota bacterium]
MTELIVGIIVVAVFLLAFLEGRRGQLDRAESARKAGRAQKESWERESILTHGQVEALREELVRSMEERLADQPEQLERVKKIIDDWANLRIESFHERRSWVRRPGETQPASGASDGS